MRDRLVVDQQPTRFGIERAAFAQKNRAVRTLVNQQGDLCLLIAQQAHEVHRIGISGCEDDPIAFDVAMNTAGLQAPQPCPASH